MDPFYRTTWAEVSLDALRANLVAFREAISDNIHIMAVVKADAYGHGAVEIAKEASHCGVTYLGVAMLDEALQLRRAGITLPILVMGYTPTHGIDMAISQRITLTVYTDEVLAYLETRRVGSDPLSIHIKYDTGMRRLGLADERAAIAFIERAASLPGVYVEGLFTHYASADEADKQFTLQQHAALQQLVERLHAQNIEIPFVHAGNSATAIDVPELAFNMVRLGISMYGFYPSEAVNHERITLKPVLSFKTKVVMVKQLPSGEGVSYGRIYRTVSDERIGTLPVGYADGYSRMLTGKAEVLVRGQRRPIVGRICMDQCMVRLDGFEDVKIGEEVILIGEQNGEVIAADEIAEKLGTIHYEVVCMIAHRVPRVYVRNQQVVHTINPLLHFH